MYIIFSDFLMIDQIFLLPQVKQGVINFKKLVYMSRFRSCCTTYNLESQYIRKYQEIFKTSCNYCAVLSPLLEMKIISGLAKISCKIEIEPFP